MSVSQGDIWGRGDIQPVDVCTHGIVFFKAGYNQYLFNNNASNDNEKQCDGVKGAAHSDEQVSTHWFALWPTAWLFGLILTALMVF